MAEQKIGLLFEGGGDLIPFLQDAREKVNGLKAAHAQAQTGIQTDLKKSGEAAKEFAGQMNVASKLVVALAGSAQQGLPALVKHLRDVADVADGVNASLSASDKANFSQVNNGLRDVAKNQGLVVGAVKAEKAARIDALVEAKKITLEEAKLLKEVQAVVDALKEAGSVAPPEIPIEPMQNLRAEYRAALTEAQNLAATPGPEYDAALAEVARLKKLLDDTASSVRNLNPGDKVRAFSQLGNAIASGAQAISGAVIAFGGNNQALQETLFKFQSALFAVQGAQQFLRDFSDSLKDVQRVLGLTTQAQELATAVGEADIVVKEGQTVATAAAGTASTAAAGGVRAFTAALLSSPLFPVILLLTALGAAFLVLSGNTDKAKKSYADLRDEIDKAAQLKGFDAELDNARRLKEIDEERLRLLTDVKLGKITQAEADKIDAESRRKAEKVLQDATIQGIRARQKAEEDAALAIQNAYNKVKPGADSSPKQREEALKFLGLTAEATADEISKAYDEMYFARVQSAEQAVTEINRIEGEQFTGAAARLKEEIDRQKELARATRDIREQLAAQIEAIEKQLADKLRSLEIGEADPREKLEVEKKVADEELALLERNLRREIALQELRVKIGTEAFQELSEAQKTARADAIIDNGGAPLSTKQEEAFAAARLLLWRDYYTKRAELQAEFDQTLADASGDGEVKQLAELDALLAEREKKLKAAGATAAEIEADAQRQTAAVQLKFSTDRLGIEEQTQVDLLEAKLAGAKGDEAQERAIQEQILKVKIEFAKKSLALIEDNGTAESKAAIAAAKKTIADLEAGLSGMKANVKPFRLSDLFNLDGEAADAFNNAARDIVGSAFDIIGQLNEAEQQRLDNQINATDALIADYQRRGDELQAQLEEDQRLNKEGLANNLNGTLAAIAANKAAEDKALADKKRLVAERQKLAKQQAIADAVQQSSSLVTAASSIFKEGALVPGGIFIAIGLVAAMVASFLAIKNKIAAATAPQQFAKGTKSVQLGGHPDGIDTVPAMLTRDEAVVPVKQNRKHRELVGAIIDDDFSSLTAAQIKPMLAHIDLSELLAGTGVVLDERAAKEVLTLNSAHRDRVERSSAANMKGVEDRLDALTAKVDAFKRQEGDRPDKTVLPDGTMVVRTKGITEYIRK